MNHVVVIGGGIVGAGAAFHLAEANVAVTLVDRKDVGHATAAGAGIIAPGTSMRPLPDFYPLAADAVRYYPTLVSKLAELDAGDPRYEVVGELYVAVTDAEFEELPHVQNVLDQRYGDGMPNLGVTRQVDAREAREMFPALGDIAGAIHIPDAARIDGDSIRNALLKGAERLGATVIHGKAHIVSATDSTAEIVINGRRSSADRVIVASGAWSNETLKSLGASIPVSPQKGQIMHVDMGSVDTSRWPILGGAGDQYILAFGPNRVVCGATREIDSGYDLRVTPGGLQSVTNAALRVAPGLAEGTVDDVRVGLRPLSDDGLPFIDRLPGHAAVIVSSGHGPSGLQLGPWSGRLAAELAMEREPSSDLSPFRIGR